MWGSHTVVKAKEGLYGQIAHESNRADLDVAGRILFQEESSLTGGGWAEITETTTNYQVRLCSRESRQFTQVSDGTVLFGAEVKGVYALQPYFQK